MISHEYTYKEKALATGERLLHRVSSWIAKIQLNSASQTSLTVIAYRTRGMHWLMSFRTIGNVCYKN